MNCTLVNRIVAALGLLCTASVSFASVCTETSVGLTPLYQTTLVPRSAAKETAALASAYNIDPDQTAVLVSIGMSNATQEFSAFLSQADSDALKNPNLVVVDGAQNGQVASIWQDANSNAWTVLMDALATKGVTADQVRMVWMKSADQAEGVLLETYKLDLDTNLRATLQVFETKFPNLELVAMSNRIYAGYASTELNPEPFAYESNVVTDNIINSNLNHPFEVIWGPYLWADGTNARGDGVQWLCDDFEEDGTHPSTSGESKVADMLLDFFRNDSVARIVYRGIPAPPPAQCEDSIDNDSDGQTDFPDDPGCADAQDDDESDDPPPPAQCQDGLDNDLDGLIDFPDDPGCADLLDDDETDDPPPVAQCEDGVDNDADALIDYPADPGCSAATDDDESDDPPPPLAQCEDGADNDSDGLIDFPTDPGCVNAEDDDESDDPPGPFQCADGLDNDSDSLIDYPADPGCASALDDDETDDPQLPVITSQPVDVSVIVPGPATFTVEATSSGTLTYQWLRDGLELPGEVSATLNLTATSTADNGALLEVVVSNSFGSVTSATATLTVQRGIEWTRHVIDVGLSGADGGRLLDVDNDNDLDLSVGWEESGITRIYLNPGVSGAVTDPWPHIQAGSASGVEDAVMGDIDGDGRPDVVSAQDSGNLVSIHFAPTTGDYTDPSGWTTASFTPPSGAPPWMYSIIIDVDEDGAPDIVAGGKGNDASIAWFKAPLTDRRNLSNWTVHHIGDIGWLMTLLAHDMDGDDDPDLLLSDRKTGSADLRGVRWLENPGTGGNQTALWVSHYIYQPDPGDNGTEVMFIDLSDIDGDGIQDVVVPLSNPSRLSWFRQLDSTGLNWTEYPINIPENIGQRAKSVRVGDIDKDSGADLVLASTALSAGEGATTSGVVWLEAENGVFSADWTDNEVSGLDGIKFDQSILIDLDGDTDLDVINTEEDAPPASSGLGIIWYENPLLDEAPPPQCGDGLDNDSDGFIDYPADPGCLDPLDDDEVDPPPPPAQCEDGVDNDLDGNIDFPADPGCASELDDDESDDPPLAQCEDGVDNDSDGLVDFPADLGCSSALDDDESNLQTLDGWVVDGSYANQDVTFDVSTGANRIVLVAISAEKNQNGPMSIASVSLGDQQLTEVFDFTVGSATGYHNLHWVGYLLEAQIAARSGSALTINYANAPSDPFDQPKIHYASFEHVNQVTPIAASASNVSTNASSLQLSNALTVAGGNKLVGFNVLGQHYNPGLSTAGYNEESESIGANNGHASALYQRTATTGSTENPTFTASTSTRMAVSALVLNYEAAQVDELAPVPNPLTWGTLPVATGTSSITMTASSATDSSGVEYYFTNTFGAGNDSGWQDSPTYEDTGLQPETVYAYTVVARDKSASQNQGTAAAEAFATTDGIPVAANVLQLDPWVVDGSYATQDAIFNVSAGTDRIVLVAVSAEKNQGGPMSVASVSLGDQQLTEIADFTVGSATGYHNLNWIGYLLETEIAARSGSTLTISYANAPSDPFDAPKIHYASYQHVDQAAPVGDTLSNTNTNTASLQFSSSLVAGDGDKIVGFAVLGQHYAPAMATAGYTEETESIGANNGHASGVYQRTATTAVTENPNFSSATSTRMAVSALVLNYAEIVEDTQPPAPDPMTWAAVPSATSDTSISMTATTATDANGVEYYFTSTSAGGHSSGWQDSPVYEDTGLLAETAYSYTVTARDKSPNQNTTAASPALSATTDEPPDTAPPAPDPMSWAAVPGATSDTSIAMTATTATDVSGVEYFFTNTAGGGNSSGWQDSPVYEDTGLQGDTEYTYTVTARDKSPNQNTTAASPALSATTDEPPDTAPPAPDPMSWAVVPSATGETSISMTATTATDVSGVEYFFTNTAGGGNSSGWQDSPVYVDNGLQAETEYTYTVTARDKSPNQNTTAASPALAATTDAPPDNTPPAPDPMTWAAVPSATSDTSISMTATTATDANGVEYYFTSTSAGGHSSGWQDSPVYEDTGLLAETAYSYTVMARDKSPNQNTTAASPALSATTDEPPDTLPPAPNPMTWASPPAPTGTSSIAMTASAASDASGVEYFFSNTAGGGNSSGWQDSPVYEDSGLLPGTSYSYTVAARDKSVNQNTTAVSQALSAITDVPPDVMPPSPDPMTWVAVPGATGTTSISMTATTASDISGVEYYFSNTAGGGHDSGWQDSPVYEDTGLLAETSYSYTVMARDKSVNQNATAPTAALAAMTDAPPDLVAPNPNPMTWAVVPGATGTTSISMTATTASDINGVEYFFSNTAGGGNSSGWQDSPVYVDTGLQPETEYSYTVAARDKSTNQNVTAVSTALPATTDTPPDVFPPIPDPLTWSAVPTATGTTSISMTATTASDPSGVQYYFTNTSGNGNDSGWQVSPVYEDIGLEPDTIYSYTVMARDNSPSQNVTFASSDLSARTTALPDTTPPDPDPLTWASMPSANGTTSISMTATTASDVSGVEYFFSNTAGGGNDSGWQDSSTYVDTGLQPDTTYSYTVMARDKSVNQNQANASTAESATTNMDVGTTEVTLLDAWVVDGSYTTQDATFNVSPGIDRIVVVAVSAEKNQGGPISIASVSLGDQPLTEVFDFTVGSATAYHNLNWVGYLLESQIASRNGSALTVSYSNAPSDPFDQAKIHYASYENVNQLAPIADSAFNSSTSASTLQPGAAVVAGEGDKIIGFNVLGQHYGPGLSTAGYSEETESIGANNGHASGTYQRTATTSVTESPTFTSSTATRMAVSTLVLNASGADLSPPQQIANAGSSVSEGGSDQISSAELLYVDQQPASDVMYTITLAPLYGQIESTASPGAAIAQFSQADIDAGTVLYVHDGSASTADEFTFGVGDGLGNALSGETFAITVTSGQPVTILDGWVVDGNYATQDATFNVSAGTDRLVVVAVSAEKNQGGPISIASVSLGDQQLTEVLDFTVGSASGYHNLNWVGYLPESQIASRNGSALTISYSNTPSNPFDQPKIHYASYQDVDQLTPITDSASNTSTSASTLSTGAAIVAGEGDKIIGFNVLGQHYGPGLSTAGYTEETESIGANNGHASGAYQRTATTSVTESPTFTSSTGTRMAVSTVVLKAATPP